MTFCIFHRHRVCLVDRVDLICSLYSWREGFGSSSLSILPLGFNCGFISSSVSHPQGFVPEAALEALGVHPSEGQVWRRCRCLGWRASGSTKYSGELMGRAAGKFLLY